MVRRMNGLWIDGWWGWMKGRMMVEGMNEWLKEWTERWMAKWLKGRTDGM